jgi:cell wall-associated NlpC family hydrolase
VSGLALAHAAESYIGARFRLRGRDRVTGFDCVGLVSAALAKAGREAPAPREYRLRQLEVEAFLPLSARVGLAETDAPVEPGDVLLMKAGPAQFHLAIAASEGGIVHAHAGLRRVVLTPFPLPWPIVRQWRLVR